MQLTLNRNVILLIIGIIGIVVPFVPYLVIIELFILLIPFGIILIATFTYLVTSFLNKNLDRGKAIFTFSILPIFIFSQFLSAFTVDRIQKIRSKKIIEEVEEHRAKTGELPKNIKTSLGIKYSRMNDKSDFVISYSRGFMVTEKYQSKYNHWTSYGWND